MRVVKKVPITFYTCNASHITNKMPILAHDLGKHKFDVVHITDAGLLKKEPTGITGYKSVKLVRKEPNRGSFIWVRADYMDRVYAPKEEATGSEIIQLQMDTIPPTIIFGVYQETGKPADEAESAHTSLRKRVTECEERGQNVGDFNAPLNKSEKPFTHAAKRILEWEETGEIRILNDKQIQHASHSEKETQQTIWT